MVSDPADNTRTEWAQLQQRSEMDGINVFNFCLGINSDVEEFQAMVDVRNSYRIKILGSNSCLLGVGGKSMSRFSS